MSPRAPTSPKKGSGTKIPFYTHFTPPEIEAIKEIVRDELARSKTEPRATA